KFEALSYMWGPRDPNCHILCEGRPLFITPNCASALLHLRKKKSPRLLWVDAICIDQDSVEEKNHQIPIVGEIYAAAEQTIAWLG
ncbi:heterokaryon incompatibility, partial [Aulographum hederae CBS 113979]